MKRINRKIYFLILCAVASTTAMAQSFTVHQGEREVSFNEESVDSIVFSPNSVKEETTSTDAARKIQGRWCSLGTSITWVNDHITEPPVTDVTKGYQTRVMEKLAFTQFVNCGVNGGRVGDNISNVVRADYYTIEHGINDWGGRIPPGSFNDYKNNTNNGTFAANYRKVIDAIFKKNPKAKVVLCTPRKAYGYNGTFPANPNDPLENGYYLKDYADLVRQIAEYESFPVADFYNECGGGRILKYLSFDEALHPNDDGYQLMANVLIQALEKVIIQAE